MTTAPPKQNTTVRYATGTYTARAPNGMRASCTISAEAAVGRLVDKLVANNKLQPGSLRAVQLKDVGAPSNVTQWCICGNDLASGAAK